MSMDVVNYLEQRKEKGNTQLFLQGHLQLSVLMCVPLHFLVESVLSEGMWKEL